MAIERKITGIILAGGKSSRMGFDKGLAETNSGKMIERAVGALKPFTSEIIIVANTTSYNYLGFPVVNDLVTEKGPLAGIYSGLSFSKTDDNIVIACDMPLMDGSIIGEIIKNIENNQVVVSSIDGKIEPLCAYYNKSVVDILKKKIDNDELAVHRVIDQLKSKIIDFTGVGYFININTQEDLKKINDGN